MKTSILIPTHNRPALLSECLKSCINQTHSAFEILIGDDSSNTESESVANSLGQKHPIIYKRNSPSLGQAGNINSLFCRASGDVLCLIHDDDKLQVDALEKLSRPFEANKDVIISFGKQHIISHEGEINEVASVNLNDSYFRTSDRVGIQADILKSALLQQIPNNGFLVRSDYAKEIGYSDPGEKYGDACDFGFSLELALKFRNHKAFFLNEYTAFYRNSLVSIARTKSDNDAAFQAFSAQHQLGSIEYKSDHDIKLHLERRCPAAISNAIQLRKLAKAWEWIFSRYHRKKLLSLGGIKRFLMLLKASLHRD